MEAEGLFRACHEKCYWILFKAICDWADGTKEDKSQRLAANNAADFLFRFLETLESPVPPPIPDSAAFDVVIPVGPLTFDEKGAPKQLFHHPDILKKPCQERLFSISSTNRSYLTFGHGGKERSSPII